MDSGDDNDNDSDKEEKKQGDKTFKNKGTVSEDKMKNKRAYKEARKKLKMKKKQGVMDKTTQ